MDGLDHVEGPMKRIIPSKRAPCWPTECPERLGRTSTKKTPRNGSCCSKIALLATRFLFDFRHIPNVLFFVGFLLRFCSFCWFFVDLSGIFLIVSSLSPPAWQADLKCFKPFVAVRVRLFFRIFNVEHPDVFGRNWFSIFPLNFPHNIANPEWWFKNQLYFLMTKSSLFTN